MTLSRPQRFDQWHIGSMFSYKHSLTPCLIHIHTHTFTHTHFIHKNTKVSKHKNTIFVLYKWHKNYSYRKALRQRNSESCNICLGFLNFWICMDAAFFGMSRFNNFLLIDATDRRKISRDRRKPIPSYIFSGTLPLMSKKRTIFKFLIV